MMWDEVMVRVIAMLMEDPIIVTLYGESIRRGGSSDIAVPLLEWHLIGDTENELWAPCIIQFDQWTKNQDDARRSEFRLRAILHSDLQLLLGGDFRVWSQYLDGSVLASPDRHGFVGRALRFQLTPMRRQYALREHVP